MASCHSASDVASRSPPRPRPTLLTSTSIPPNFATVVATTRSTSAGSHMRWQGRSGSGNIEDRRGMGLGLPVGGGIGGIVLLLLFSALTGTNPLDVINSTSSESGSVGTSGVSSDDPQAQFVSVVLKDTEDTWRELF